MPSAVKGIFMIVTVMLMCCSIYSYERDSTKKRSSIRRSRPRQMRNRFDAIRRQHMLELQALQNAPEWSRMSVPEIPSAEDVDCNIEVEVTEVIGGRCVRLGGAGRLAVCQSGMYLDVHNEECQQILARREMNLQSTDISPQQSELNAQFFQSVPENGVPDNGVPENGVTVNELSGTQQAAENE